MKQSHVGHRKGQDPSVLSNLCFNAGIFVVACFGNTPYQFVIIVSRFGWRSTKHGITREFFLIFFIGPCEPSSFEIACNPKSKCGQLCFPAQLFRTEGFGVWCWSWVQLYCGFAKIIQLAVPLRAGRGRCCTGKEHSAHPVGLHDYTWMGNAFESVYLNQSVI